MKAIFKFSNSNLHKSQKGRDLLRALDMPFEDELQHNINDLDTFL
ncbi:hypothetical protein T11_7564 [Trichinella zimbabwensis]|uniref:Uncharacterized protein n=1 Tax=Trichinella zimbabwensis TaxID=268475 RepID=A0A0V1G7H0_9BILA|nr:hypothetical protein T11_7564 [Trichinella zimbabwensis]